MRTLGAEVHQAGEHKGFLLVDGRTPRPSRGHRFTIPPSSQTTSRGIIHAGMGIFLEVSADSSDGMEFFRRRWRVARPVIDPAADFSRGFAQTTQDRNPKNCREKSSFTLRTNILSRSERRHLFLAQSRSGEASPEGPRLQGFGCRVALSCSPPGRFAWSVTPSKADASAPSRNKSRTVH